MLRGAGAGAGPELGRHCQYLCACSIELSGATQSSKGYALKHALATLINDHRNLISLCRVPWQEAFQGKTHQIQPRKSSRRPLQAYADNFKAAAAWSWIGFKVVGKWPHHLLWRTQWEIPGAQFRYWASVHSCVLLSGHASPRPPHWKKSGTKPPAAAWLRPG